MQKYLFQLEKKSIRTLEYWILLLAVMIAAQVQYIQHGWINPDSVLYLEAAKFFSNGDWKAGFEVFSWPFYSLCITLVNTITHLGVHVSAQILNVLFFAITTYSYLKIIQLAGGKQRQIIAGALIWLSAQYMIGGVLEMLMRDEGFWAFYLLSIVFFIRFYQQHHFKDALLWQVCIILATLFRIEAILYLMFLPLLLLFQSGLSLPQKWKNLASANSINLSLAFIITAVFGFNDALSTKLLGRLNEVFTTNLWQQFTNQLVQKSGIMSDKVLGEYLNEFAVQGLLVTFIYIIIVKTISATGLVNIILSAFAVKQHNQLIQLSAYKVLRTTAIIALLNMALIITKVFVLSGRYVLALSFILMVFAAFYLAELLFSEAKNKKEKLFIIGIMLLMLGSALKNILPKKQGYNYMQDAVAWIEKANKKKSPVFYDDNRMKFYAGQTVSYDQVKHATRFDSLLAEQTFKKYEFIVLNHSKNNPEYVLHAKNTLTDYAEINRFFDGKKRKFIIIYKRNF